MQNKSESWDFGYTEKIETMAAKIAALVFGSLNIFLYVFAWVANLDNIKSTILFVVALCMSLYRFYRWTLVSKQNKRLKDIQIRKEEIELLEREISAKRDKKVKS